MLLFGATLWYWYQFNNIISKTLSYNTDSQYYIELFTIIIIMHTVVILAS